jgi:CheY-like chemotaxis protein
MIRALVVDDNPHSREPIREVLQSEDCLVLDG